jgi:hypothetical protein
MFSMFDGPMYHYCSPPVMTSSTREIKQATAGSGSANAF